MKRKLNFNPCVKKGMKKFRRENIMSITSMENLSNEIFYEIFDYLDGCHIYQAFSNLNQHFELILNSSLILFKIKFDTESDKFYDKFYKQMKCLNRNQIYSLNLHLPLENKNFFSSFFTDSSLDNLKCVTLNQIKPDLLLSVLFNLSTSSNLYSLTIDIFNVFEYSTDILRIVFRLRGLKYFKFSTNNSNLSMSLPIVNSEDYSPIKYLVLNHCYTLSDLSSIVSYTPQLRHLDYTFVNINHSSIGNILPITLPNLTRLELCLCDIKYEEFEIFMSKIDAKLIKSFIMSIASEDIRFLDAIRWKEIILKYLPKLKQFLFQYHEYFDYEYESPTDLGEPNQFISSFWIERQLILEVLTKHQAIQYTICSYEKRWYEYNTQFDMINSSNQLLKSARLCLTDIPPLECQDLITIFINRALTFTQYYHLEISDEPIFHGVLLQIVDLLKELDSLKVHSLSCDEPRKLCEFEVDILLSEESKITKVYLEIMMEITDIFFLMVLCPRMNYLKVSFINNMDIQLFVRRILNKINSERNKYLRLLCFRVEAADDEIIKKLEKMINTEKLIVDYSIKRVCNNIYLQWK